MVDKLSNELEAYLNGRLPHYLDLLERWVSTNSFTSNPDGVNANGRLIEAAFARLGFRAEHIQAENPLYGRHTILTRRGTGTQKVGLVTHLDTVFPPAEERANDFRWRVVGNRIYGPGTVDIKGGTAVIYMVMDALAQMAPDLFESVTWVVLANAAEEVLTEDFGRLCLERLDGAAACLVFEGGMYEPASKTFKIVVARKGMATYRLECEGRAAHAGVSHEHGANAIVEMAQAVQRIAGFTDYERQITFNVGVMTGGIVLNRVPHFASAGVEMRAFDPDVFADGVNKMLALPSLATVRAAGNGFRCQLRVNVLSETPPWSPNDATDRLYQVWADTGRELGYHVEREARGGLSDGNLIWARIPTIDGLGPSGGNSHCSERSEDGTKEQEYATADSFVPKALLNAVALIKLLQA